MGVLVLLAALARPRRAWRTVPAAAGRGEASSQGNGGIHTIASVQGVLDMALALASALSTAARTLIGRLVPPTERSCVAAAASC